MIRISELSKKHSNGVVALDRISLEVDKDEFIYLVGPSGSGKSTLLRMIYKEDTPTEGDVYIENFNIKKIPQKKIPFLRRNIGVVFQDYKLLPKRTVYENVAFALRVMHIGRSKIHRQVSQILELVGLHEKMHHLPSELSGGEQQRICIARAIVNNPPILLADEPTGSLDPDTSWEIMKLLSKINTRQTTVIVATHDKSIVSDLRKRVVALDNGRIVRDKQLGMYDE